MTNPPDDQDFRDAPPQREDYRDDQGRQRPRSRIEHSEQERSASAPGERSRASDPARLVAFDVMRKVDESDSYANLLLPVLLRERGIRGRDAAFATELCYGTLRRQGSYDAFIALAADRPAEEIDAPVRDGLRLGAHQLFAMRVGAYAAVSETVGLVRQRIGIGPSQFTNAVLRKLSERSFDEWLEEAVPAEETEFVRRASIEYSHPEWIIRALRESLVMNGRPSEEISELLAANNEAPAVTLVARPGLIDVARFRENRGLTPGRWSPYAATGISGDPGGLFEVRDSLVGVQDEGSQLVALALAEADVTPRPDGNAEEWLDLCAGPGGKAALLGAIAAERGAWLTAIEPIPHRADLVRQAVAPLGDVVEVVTGDARDGGHGNADWYDRIIVDVPCTGLGAMRRRPESRWRRTPADIAQLAPLQRELLTAALDMVRPGGVVAYVTCSPHLAETRFVVEDACRGRDDITQIDAAAVLERIAGAPMPGVVGPAAQLWPHLHGTDAMYLSLLRKAS